MNFSKLIDRAGKRESKNKFYKNSSIDIPIPLEFLLKQNHAKPVSFHIKGICKDQRLNNDFLNKGDFSST